MDCSEILALLREITRYEIEPNTDRIDVDVILFQIWGKKYQQIIFSNQERTNNLAKLVRLIKEGFNINYTDKDENTPLIIGCKNNVVEIVKMLICCDAKVNHANKLGKTALFYAIERKAIDIVQCLIEHGADVNHVDINGRTCLHEAAKLEHLLLVHVLIAHGAKVHQPDKTNVTPLFLACGNSGTISVKIVKYFILHGASINHPRSEDKCTPLIYACMNADSTWEESAAPLLINYGAEINAKDVSNRSALFYAIQNEHEGNVEELIEAPVSDNCIVGDYHSRLIEAIRVQDYFMVECIVKQLIKYDYTLNYSGSECLTPLMVAIKYSDTKIIVLLLINGADLEYKNELGENAIDFAARVSTAMHAYLQNRTFVF